MAKRRSREERLADFSYVRWGVNRVNSLFKNGHKTEARLVASFTQNFKEEYPSEWEEILIHIKEVIE
tara:strand:- start:8680 stop:8880 length:201 start_codon:yes stop_codon:yes gene_type:complete